MLNILVILYFKAYLKKKKKLKGIRIYNTITISLRIFKEEGSLLKESSFALQRKSYNHLTTGI